MEICFTMLRVAGQALLAETVCPRSGGAISFKNSFDAYFVHDVWSCVPALRADMAVMAPGDKRIVSASQGNTRRAGKFVQETSASVPAWAFHSTVSSKYASKIFLKEIALPDRPM
jgi:hypothetical protein